MTSAPTSPQPDLRNWISDHLRSYLGTGGTSGHILDLRPLGMHEYTPHVLIRYVGRKSGRTMITPLIYGTTAGEVCIVASKGGAPEHPAWYLNIKSSETVDFQVATEAFRATWREPAGEERAWIWNMMERVFPNYTAYQARTDREIPLVLMKPTERLPVFRPEDVG